MLWGIVSARANMAEKEKSEEKKKGGKLPIIVALALVLGGGGFFMTKKKAPEVPKIEQAEEGSTVGEMTINLKDASTYVKFELVMIARKDYPKELLDKNLDIVRDYLNAKVPEYSLRELQTADGKAKVKKEICAGINDLLPADPKTLEALGAQAKKKKKKKSADDEPDAEPEGEAAHWDSQEGPVLKVMFKTFAWQ